MTESVVGGTAESGDVLSAPIDLPCGLRLQNRLVKAAMSDSLGDGTGQPTEDQIALYRRWARGGVGLSIIGEVQVDPRYPEKPGNLVLGEGRDGPSFERLAAALGVAESDLEVRRRGRVPHLWLRGAPAPVDLSLSHHGDWLGFACELEPTTAGVIDR